MSSIFGVIAKSEIDEKNIKTLAKHSRQRGFGASDVLVLKHDKYYSSSSDCDITKLLKLTKPNGSLIYIGQSYSKLNQIEFAHTSETEGLFLFYDGMIVNREEIIEQLALGNTLLSDSEIIIKAVSKYLKENQDLKGLPEYILSNFKGAISAALILQSHGKMFLFSNTGSLFIGESKDKSICFSSEKYPLEKLECKKIKQIYITSEALDIPRSQAIEIIEHTKKKMPDFNFTVKKALDEESMIQYSIPNLKRCTMCVLPETMPFIDFDEEGVCNYCRNYKLRNKPKPKEELFELVKPYRRENEPDCIVPFSGGRDSCYALHLIVNELKMNPITYTYDWGMVTDLGQRNISRMSSILGVENIVVSADIKKKLNNIRKNLLAWLKSPNLGMLNILTAGDKHFFQHVETIKKQTGIALNLWGINPLEVTHFKSGFLGIKPDFAEDRVYMTNISKQLEYQYLRLKSMFKSPRYFNNSIWDTLSGEYYRSFLSKKDYFHVFDYWRWDEKIVNNTLRGYDWELASDTKTTWRIGDGTAALYNYIYYTVAGFTEHDTFRSNQIREGQILRGEALDLIQDENRPRYENISWYLNKLGFPFVDVIKTINEMPKLYSS